MATKIPVQFPEEHCDTCTKIMQETVPYLDHANKCLAAGIPCQDVYDLLKAQHDAAAGIKAVFYPDHP